MYFLFVCFCFLFAMLGIEPRALCFPGEHSPTKLHPSLLCMYLGSCKCTKYLRSKWMENYPFSEKSVINKMFLIPEFSETVPNKWNQSTFPSKFWLIVPLLLIISWGSILYSTQQRWLDLRNKMSLNTDDSSRIFLSLVPHRLWAIQSLINLCCFPPPKTVQLSVGSFCLTPRNSLGRAKWVVNALSHLPSHQSMGTTLWNMCIPHLSLRVIGMITIIFSLFHDWEYLLVCTYTLGH